jgi:hypothetical protein
MFAIDRIDSQIAKRWGRLASTFLDPKSIPDGAAQ